MPNPDPEGLEPEQREESPAGRRPEQITLRDFDKIEERKPFTLKAFHLKLAAAAAIGLVAAAVLVGWMLGRESRVTRPAQAKITAPEGIVTDADKKPEKTPAQPHEVRGSVLPVPEPLPRGPEPSIRPARRGWVTPEIDMTPAWWVAAVDADCAFTCTDPYCACEKDEPVTPPPAAVPVPAPLPEPAVEPIPEPAAEPVPERVPEPSPDVIAGDAATMVDNSIGQAAEKVEQPGKKAAKPDTDVGKAEGTSKPVAREVRKETPKEPPKEVPPRQFSVQIRSFKEEPVAKEFANTLDAKGYNTFVVTYVDPNGLTWFRVRTGHFASAADATAFAAELNAKEGEQAIPVEVK